MLDSANKSHLQNKFWFQILITLLIQLGATMLSMLIRNIGFSEINIVVIYILSVLVVSRFTKGYFYGIMASIIGMFCFNFFFTEPLHTFLVYNRSYIMTFGVMLTASILTSTLTSKIMRSSYITSQREKQFQILYQITSSLAKASSISDVATVSVQCLSNLLDCDVSCITTDANGNINHEYSIQKGSRGVTSQLLTKEQAELTISDQFILPIADQRYQYGLICLPKCRVPNESEQSKLLSSVSTQIFTAMERERLATEKEKAKNEAEREKFKSNLLRAISHDIRTPLSGIRGASELLLSSLTDEDSVQLVQGIYDGSVWLTQMVENILSLTKIQEGTLLANKKMEAAEEIIGVALKYSSRYASQYHITAKIPDKVIFVPMDGKLISQVLINLIENAVKHSQESNEIKIEVTTGKHSVWFSVADHGTGINPEDLPKIFDMFYVANEARVDSKRGNGLGLAICKAIVNAHGGRIVAENNTSGGATIRFSLPLEGGKGFGEN
jgi:two-component system, OmpR family, sensor histidine kinase KdpD